LSEIINSEEFRGNEKEVFGAIRFCKKNNWISILDDKVTVLSNSDNFSDEENFIAKLNKAKSMLESHFENEDKKAYESLKKRHDILTTAKLVDKKIPNSTN
jgi:phenylalanyl-tRNA synthetase alpha chain